MQGTVIHYDLLTCCGLVRTEDGNCHYFRNAQLSDASFVVENQRVLVSGNNESLQIDTRLSALTRPANPATTGTVVRVNTMPLRIPNASYQDLLNATPAASPASLPLNPRVRGGVIRNWPGTVAAVVAFCLLLMAGNNAKPGRPEHAIPLLTSWWAVAAAVLLIMITYLQAIGGRLVRVRLTFWVTTACSGLAYFVQSYKGFQADTITEWYFYALVVLFLIIYILPYKRSQL